MWRCLTAEVDGTARVAADGDDLPGASAVRRRRWQRRRQRRQARADADGQGTRAGAMTTAGEGMLTGKGREPARRQITTASETAAVAAMTKTAATAMATATAMLDILSHFWWEGYLT
jgi:hypothetical protein